MALTNTFHYSGNMTKEQQAVIDIIDFTGVRTGLIEMKTGRWKSHVIMNIVNLFQEKTLIVVHNTGTLDDMVKKFEEFTNYEVGVWYGKKSTKKKSYKEIKDITITTHASFMQQYKEFSGKFGIVIIDECDYNFTESMIEAVCNSDIEWLFGLTATPQTQEFDRNDLELFFGRHIKISEQDVNWYNMVPDIIRILYYSDAFAEFESWHDLRDQLIMYEPRINKQMEYIHMMFATKQINIWVLLVSQKENECYMYAERWKNEHPDIPYVVINWDTKQKDDEEGVEMLKSKWKWLIIGTVGKIWRGKDIPMIDWVFLFFPNKFENSTIQAVWRWLRHYPGKTRCLLIDWVDTPALVWQAAARLKTYKKEYTENVKIADIHLGGKEKK